MKLIFAIKGAPGSTGDLKINFVIGSRDSEDLRIHELLKFMSNVCAYIYLYLYLHILFANLSTILYKCFCPTPTSYGGHLRAKPPLTANSAARSKVGL